MKGRQLVNDYRLSRFSSAFFLVCIFILIIAVAFLATFYASGVLNPENSQVNAFSISSAVCNSTGVFLSLKNNLAQKVSVESAEIVGLNQTLLLSKKGIEHYTISGDSSVELNSGVYSCPSFNSLSQVDLLVDSNSSSTVVYTFGNNYWLDVLSNPYTNVSESVR